MVEGTLETECGVCGDDKRACHGFGDVSDGGVVFLARVVGRLGFSWRL